MDDFNVWLLQISKFGGTILTVGISAGFGYSNGLGKS
jgi:hypothetical protein